MFSEKQTLDEYIKTLLHLILNRRTFSQKASLSYFVIQTTTKDAGLSKVDVYVATFNTWILLKQMLNHYTK